MTKLDKALERYACNAEYERAHGNLQGCLEFKKLCEWLKELKQLKQLKQLREPRWIPVSERLPKINQSVLLSGNNGTVFVGHKCKPDFIWQVITEDGRKDWVYDPESYTDDVDSLPKAEDCSFEKDDTYHESMLSVTSLNYNERFKGVIAWMPLPEPYKAESEDKDGE